MPIRSIQQLHFDSVEKKKKKNEGGIVVIVSERQDLQPAEYQQ